MNQIPVPKNEPVLNYAPGSKEKIELKKVLAELKSTQLDIKMTINGQKVASDDRRRIHPPHELSHTLGYYYKGSAKEVQAAIDAALTATVWVASTARPVQPSRRSPAPTTPMTTR